MDNSWSKLACAWGTYKANRPGKQLEPYVRHERILSFFVLRGHWTVFSASRFTASPRRRRRRRPSLSYIPRNPTGVNRFFTPRELGERGRGHDPLRSPSRFLYFPRNAHCTCTYHVKHCARAICTQYILVSFGEYKFARAIRAKMKNRNGHSFSVDSIENLDAEFVEDLSKTSMI